ncbi:hypothetical protein HSX11_22010 [Oxalobacteraceae bacterium]|nr:hypothetical protein [Oxalobacteraceae bacterium]
MASSNQGGNQDNKQGSKSGGSQQSDTSKRGFASMDPAQQREIASEGGRAAHEKGTAHEFTSEEARRAGAMSHKNDASSQSSSSGSASRSGASATDRDDEEEDRTAGGKGSSSGSGSGSRSGGSGSKS